MQLFYTMYLILFSIAERMQDITVSGGESDEISTGGVIKLTSGCSTASSTGDIVVSTPDAGNVEDPIAGLAAGTGNIAMSTGTTTDGDSGTMRLSSGEATVSSALPPSICNICTLDREDVVDRFLYLSAKETPVTVAASSSMRGVRPVQLLAAVKLQSTVVGAQILTPVMAVTVGM
jgi:hypothetical protein